MLQQATGQSILTTPPARGNRVPSEKPQTCLKRNTSGVLQRIDIATNRVIEDVKEGPSPWAIS